MQSWKKAIVFGSIGVGAVLVITRRRPLGMAFAAAGLAVLASEYPEKFEAVWESAPEYLQKGLQIFSTLKKGVGIAAPFSPRHLAEVAYLTGAIATSGTYERGNHLIDPHSGRPMARAASASVTGPDLGLADALATALAIAGSPGLDVIAALEGYEALIIALDGARHWTEHFPFAQR